MFKRIFLTCFLVQDKALTNLNINKMEAFINIIFPDNTDKIINNKEMDKEDKGNK